MKKLTTALTIAAAAVAANAACAGFGTAVNTSIWFDGSDQQVNTGGDGMYNYETCTTTKMGYWFDYDDRKNDHGGSYVSYPYDPDEYKSLIAPMITNLGYVAVGYTLVDPTTTGQTEQYPYNFVGMGFNIVDAAKTPFNISGANGLCATYTSDHPITLEVEEAKSGSASCAVTLQAASTPTTVSKSIADFTQPDWAAAQGYGLSSCADAFAAASAVKFKIDGQASAISGTLRIFEVGPAGTCVGGKSIGAEPGFTKKSNGNGGLDDGTTPSAINGVAAATSAKAILSGRTLSFSGFSSDAKFEIVSLQGQVVKSGIASSSVSLSSLNAGIYMVRVSGKAVNMTQKIIVK